MRKSIFIAPLLAIALTGCSNDEPAANGGENDNGNNGKASYLSVSINDAAMLSRATGDTDATEGEFDYGSGNEGVVGANDAKFFFFNENGVYVTQAKIWDGGTANKPNPDQNIEFTANNIVVLENLTSDNFPKYMVTVLNCGTAYADADMKGKTITEFSKDITNWGTNSAGGFLMTTSSYYDNPKTPAGHDKYYFATELKQENFKRTPEAAKADGNAVVVYVERLAARVRLKSAASFDVDATVAGSGNTELTTPGEGDTNTGTGVAGTKLKVVIDGWFLNQTQPKSYLSKQLSDFSIDVTDAPKIANVNGKWDWNQPGLHRSWWGESFGYNTNVIDGLTRNTYGTTNAIDVINGSAAAYCNENTNTATVLGTMPNLQMLTSVVVKAHVTNAEGTAMDIVEFNGLYFTYESIYKYALNVEKPNLNYYYVSKAGTEATEGNPGTPTEYTQIDDTMFDYEIVALNADDPNNGVKVTVKANTKLPEELYTLGDGGYTKITDTNIKTTIVNQINTAFTTFFTTNKAIGFENGQMYYNIPIAHLNAPVYWKAEDEEVKAGRQVAGDLKTWKEGSFGVVRNHTYEVEISSVKHLGTGIFDPSKGVIKPDPSKKTYWYLGAKVNILSWKIVNNSVDL